MSRVPLHFLPALLILSIVFSKPTTAQTEDSGPRSRIRFTENWKFNLGDVQKAKEPAFDASEWRTLDLPHDWSIEQDFDKESQAGPGGGYLPGGIGWYRKSFKVPEAQKNKKVFIDFDGVYRNSKVWINGHYLGNRPWGYISFRYDLTPYLNYGDNENTLAVRVNNDDQPNSRWYSGSGIYRNVWLVKTNKLRVQHWGTYNTTPVVNQQEAYVSARTNVVNGEEKEREVKLRTEIVDEEGAVVASDDSVQTIPADSTAKFTFNLHVANPILWSVEDPYLYTTISKVIHDGEVVDRYETPLGIRYFNFDRNDGFSLNGKPMKIRGVCEHHDLGSLGAAFNKSAVKRRLTILKKMGVNAIRTAHNPPAPELLELTDQMGFIVMNESFDVWNQQKVDHDYHKFFEEWHARDLRDLIRRDRNHPSVVIWSIGNEILEQWDASSIATTRELARITRELDDTRPITAGLNGPSPSNTVIRSGALDLIGYNYHNEQFSSFNEDFPAEKFIATETTSALGTRGFYQMPSDSVMRWPKAWDEPFEGGNDAQTVSCYDNVSTPWGSTHEEALRSIQSADHLSGMFIWTGFDYIGEPTPYKWPSRSSYFGILDLAGFPKDAYYLYRSQWTDTPTLHLFPHWNNWRRGDTVDVLAYTNATRVELFVNGESMGVRKNTENTYHLKWEVPYEPGKLKAVGRTQEGNMIQDSVQTAGKPALLNLSSNRDTIKANGRDLSFIQVAVRDEKGVLVPDAGNKVHFDVSGPGKIVGVSSGDPTSHESFKADHRKAFNGRCQVTVQSTAESGPIRLKAESDGLQPQTITIYSQ